MDPIKFHITDNGPMPCHAQEGNCPLRGSTHYSDPLEAQKVYEQINAPRNFAVMGKPKAAGWSNWPSEDISPGGPRDWVRGAAGDRYDYEMNQLILENLEHYQKLYGNPITGTNRACFDMGNGKVLKMPMILRGEAANIQEATAGAAPDDWYFTPAEQEWSPSGFPVLIAEKVTPISSDDPEYPDWAGFIDCGKVGRTSDGKIYAYDL